MDMTLSVLVRDQGVLIGALEPCGMKNSNTLRC